MGGRRQEKRHAIYVHRIKKNKTQNINLIFRMNAQNVTVQFPATGRPFTSSVDQK